jgi:competence protein ComEC
LIQPKLYQIYKPKYIIDKKIWEIISVSLAAQIGVLPLSLFYFHQFPGLFMLSNLVIIPALGAILVGGILIIAFALMGFLPQFVALIYGFVISLMNRFISWISQQEQFLFTEISISFSMMLFLYLAIILGVNFFIQKKVKELLCFLVAIVFVQSIYVFENHQKKNKNEFIVFHKSRNTIIGNRVGAQLFVNHDLDSLAIANNSAMISYKIGENVNQKFKKGFSNLIKYENETILIVDSLGVYQLKNLKNFIVLLQQSPKINLERLITELAPKQIIADGSNYKSSVKNWEETAKKLEVPFYYTGKNGAFFLKK